MIINLFLLFFAGVTSCYFLFIEKQSKRNGWIFLTFGAFVGNLLYFVYAIYPKSSHAIDHNLWNQHSELFTFIILEMIVLIAFGIISGVRNKKKNPQSANQNQTTKSSSKYISSLIFVGYLLFFGIFYIAPNMGSYRSTTIDVEPKAEKQKPIKWLVFTNEKIGFSIDYPEGAVIKDFDSHLDMDWENGSKLSFDIGSFIDSPEERKVTLKNDIIQVSEQKINGVAFTLIESEIPYFGHVYEYSSELDSNKRICFQLISPIDSDQGVRNIQLKIAKSFKFLRKM
jgi:NADH:ubiquinone oxidoreductase subunit 6 (subunit J)